MFRNFEKKVDFKGIVMKTHQVRTDNPVDEKLIPYGETQEMKIKSKSKWGTGMHTMVVAPGYIWNFHWMEGIDFSHVSTFTTQ
jgi:hypothetical protein